MSEIVDRVTTAIFVAIAKKMSTDPICPASEVGRAAIAAMREPTPKMIEAGRMFWATEDHWYNFDAGKLFQAMIDEALK